MIKDINAVITRINEIRSRFGMKPHEQDIPDVRNSFDNTLKDTIKNDNIKADKDISVNQIKDLASNYAVKFGVPPALVDAVIKTESGYNVNAVSNKGALGLMQLMPSVAKSVGVTEPFDVNQNLQGGITILKDLLQKYNWDYRKALAAYNAGEGAVEKFGGVPPYKETKDYVKRVIDLYLENSEKE